MPAKTTKGRVMISAEVPAELRVALDARAKTESRSRSEIINRACRFFLAHAEVEKKENGIPKLKGKGK